MVDLDETMLPGVGVRYGLTTRAGDRLAVVVQREGGAEVAVFDRRDPDRARAVFRLDAEETGVLAELLGAPRLTQRFVDLSREVPGLESARFLLRPGSPFDGRPLGDTRARTLTGCSIVAVVRENDVVPSPGPAEVLHAGDVLVAIGSDAGLTRLGARLDGAA
ncbi:cation:proton antiporter regulatory subunit [Geodermatophilus sp. SYSU D00684]